MARPPGAPAGRRAQPRPALEHAGTALRTYSLYMLKLTQPSISIPLRRDGDTVHYQLRHDGRPGAVHSEVRRAATCCRNHDRN